MDGNNRGQNSYHETYVCTDDVELCVQGLENDLQQATLPRDCWKLILTSRLTLVLKDFLFHILMSCVCL